MILFRYYCIILITIQIHIEKLKTFKTWSTLTKIKRFVYIIFYIAHALLCENIISRHRLERLFSIITQIHTDDTRFTNITYESNINVQNLFPWTDHINKYSEIKISEHYYLTLSLFIARNVSLIFLVFFSVNFHYFFFKISPNNTSFISFFNIIISSTWSKGNFNLSFSLWINFIHPFFLSNQLYFNSAKWVCAIQFNISKSSFFFVW